MNCCHYNFTNDAVKGIEQYQIEEGVPIRVHKKANYRRYIFSGIVAFILLLVGLGISIWASTKGIYYSLIQYYTPIKILKQIMCSTSISKMNIPTNKGTQEVSTSAPNTTILTTAVDKNHFSGKCNFQNKRN